MRSRITRPCRRRLALVLGSAITFVACGGAEPGPVEVAEAPVASATPAAGTPTQQTESEEASVVPTDCKEQGKLCLPPAAFGKKLCTGAHPDIALAFFKKGTPFTRMYMSHPVEKPWNSHGAASEEKLAFDEEVIILISHQNKSSIQVSGAGGSYDVLRWDGTCATLATDEVRSILPPKALNATVRWQDLGEDIQAALLKDEALAKLNKLRRDECKGATIGSVTDKCVKAVDKLSAAIVSHVRGGGDIPVPAKLP